VEELGDKLWQEPAPGQVVAAAVGPGLTLQLSPKPVAAWVILAQVLTVGLQVPRYDAQAVGWIAEPPVVQAPPTVVCVAVT